MLDEMVAMTPLVLEGPLYTQMLQVQAPAPAGHDVMMLVDKYPTPNMMKKALTTKILRRIFLNDLSFMPRPETRHLAQECFDTR